MSEFARTKFVFIALPPLEPDPVLMPVEICFCMMQFWKLHNAEYVEQLFSGETFFVSLNSFELLFSLYVVSDLHCFT